jgi:predicted nucleic acid-binding protein
MIYALDSNIVIKLLRDEPIVCMNFNSAVIHRAEIVIPKAVHYEIMRGFRILNAPGKQKAYNAHIGGSGKCRIVSVDDSCWERAEHIYAELHRKSLTIGEMDILIAAVCLENNYTLVTSNIKDFKNIDGLNIVNWLTESA